MGKTFQKPEALADTISHYCPGCTHGIAHRLVAEVIDELGIRGRTVGIAPVGCAVLMYNYFTFDFQEAAHGRAPAMATGIKRVRPDLMVFTYQGDGDLASIGMGEIVHAANRGEKFTTIFINNAVYGMTGGQMAPTTMPNQRTTTSPFGRKTGNLADALLYYPANPDQTQIRQQGQKGHQKSLYVSNGRSLLQPGGTDQHLPHKLGDDVVGRHKMGGRKNAAVFPAG